MLSAMIKKEFILVTRDIHALMALFILPAVFIIIMSVAMRDQFSTSSLEFTIVVADKDKSNMSIDLIQKMKNNKNIKIIKDENKAQFLVKIPELYSKTRDAKLKINVNGSIKSNQIEIFKSILSREVLAIKFNMIAKALKVYAPKASESIDNLDTNPDTLFKVKYNGSKNIPNSTQQSVPAWIVFGMFFIIIPMSTIYVNERKQNTLARLNTMNISVFAMTLSKSIPYMLINQVQVWIMLAVGMFLVPYFNVPALELNGSIWAIFAISLGLSISAIGVSSLIAVSASTSEQATTIGGISNILLGAIGGVMVPKFIMPEAMQEIANLSPMSWGLDGFLDIFLKSADVSMILNEVISLVVFGLSALIISMIILDKRIKKGL